MFILCTDSIKVHKRLRTLLNAYFKLFLELEQTYLAPCASYHLDSRPGPVVAITLIKMTETFPLGILSRVAFHPIWRLAFSYVHLSSFFYERPTESNLVTGAYQGGVGKEGNKGGKGGRLKQAYIDKGTVTYNKLL